MRCTSSLFFLAAALMLAGATHAAPAPQNAPAAAPEVQETGVGEAFSNEIDIIQEAADEAQADVDEDAAPALARRDLYAGRATYGNFDNVDEYLTPTGRAGAGEDTYDDVDEHLAPIGHAGGVMDHNEQRLVQGGPVLRPAVLPGHVTTTTTAIIAAGGPFAMPVINPHALSANSFYIHETFTLYNRDKGTCLFVKEGKEPKLIMKRCNLHQRFVEHSPFAFHWLPTHGQNHARLAIMHGGHELCATDKTTGTFFYPCTTPKVISYSLGTRDKDGAFMVRDADKSSQCMDSFLHSGVHMRRCRTGKDDQRFEKIHIGFL